MPAITEEWLKEAGFKWHQVDRQDQKQWLLWLSQCVDCGQPWRFTSFEDLGIEVSSNGRSEDPYWFCWLRGDSAGRYHRFIHIRHLRDQDELVAIIAALTGRPWNTRNHLYGAVCCDKCTDRILQENERLDRRLKMTESRTWYEAEKDETRGGALPEHLDEAIKRGGAK